MAAQQDLFETFRNRLSGVNKDLAVQLNAALQGLKQQNTPQVSEGAVREVRNILYQAAQDHPEILQNLAEGQEGIVPIETVEEHFGRAYLENPLENQQETAAPQKGLSPSDFFPKNERHDGGGPGYSGPEAVKDPEIHTYIQDQQKADMLDRLKKISQMQEGTEKELALNGLVESFSSKAILDDYHDRLIKQLQTLSSYQKLSPDQRKALEERLHTQHNMLLQENSKDYARGTNLQTHPDRQKQLRDQLKQLTLREFDKRSEDTFNSLLESQRKPLKGKMLQKYHSSFWQKRGQEDFDFSEILNSLLSFRYVSIPVPRLVPPMPQRESPPVTSTPQRSSSPTRPQTRPMRRPPSRIGKAAKNVANKIGKKLIKEAGKGILKFLAANPEIAAIILAVLLGIIILIAIIIAIAKLVSLNSGTSSPTPTPTPAPFAYSCNPSNTCVARLKAMGIVVSGNLSLQPVPAAKVDPFGKAAVLYEILARATTPPSNFGKLLGLPQKQVSIVFHTGTSCSGHASISGRLDFYGWCGTTVIDEFMLLHELGHMIAFRNPLLYWGNFVPRYFALQWQYKNMPTYNCMYDYGAGPYAAECWADMIGEYVVYKDYRNTVGGKPSGPYNFPTFPHFANGFYYNFAKNNIFNDVQY